MRADAFLLQVRTSIYSAIIVLLHHIRVHLRSVHYTLTSKTPRPRLALPFNNTLPTIVTPTSGRYPLYPPPSRSPSSRHVLLSRAHTRVQSPFHHYLKRIQQFYIRLLVTSKFCPRHSGISCHKGRIEDGPFASKRRFINKSPLSEVWLFSLLLSP